LYGHGRILSIEGRLSDAKAGLAESLAIAQQLDNPRTSAFALYEQAEIALLEADVVAARRLQEESLAILTEINEPLGIADSRLGLARVALEENRLDDAAALAREAATGFASLPDTAGEAWARATLVHVLLAQNRPDEARREMAAAQALRVGEQHLLVRLRVAIAAGRLDALDDPAAAIQALEAVRTQAAGLGITRLAFEAQLAIAEIQETRSPEAGRAAREALRRDALAAGLPLYAR
jgi:hypothetical protein